MKRILVCGGRDYGRIDPKKIGDHPKRRAERRRVFEVLDELKAKHGELLVIHGGARGADALANSWALTNCSATPLAFPADWNNVARPGAVVKTTKRGVFYDAAAGGIRNGKMLKEGKPDLAIAFPGGTGTADMIERARAAKVAVEEIDRIGPSNENRVFVFGSNLAGRHGAGAALFASKYRGAIYGQGKGWQGMSYAIPTKDAGLRTLPLDAIERHVDDFLLFAACHPGMEFEATKIGCGLAGYSEAQIAPMFKGASANCFLPEGWNR